MTLAALLSVATPHLGAQPIDYEDVRIFLLNPEDRNGDGQIDGSDLYFVTRPSLASEVSAPRTAWIDANPTSPRLFGTSLRTEGEIADVEFWGSRDSVGLPGRVDQIRVTAGGQTIIIGYDERNLPTLIRAADGLTRAEILWTVRSDGSGFGQIRWRNELGETGLTSVDVPSDEMPSLNRSGGESGSRWSCESIDCSFQDLRLIAPDGSAIDVTTLDVFALDTDGRNLGSLPVRRIDEENSVFRVSIPNPCSESVPDDLQLKQRVSEITGELALYGGATGLAVGAVAAVVGSVPAAVVSLAVGGVALVADIYADSLEQDLPQLIRERSEWDWPDQIMLESHALVWVEDSWATLVGSENQIELDPCRGGNGSQAIVEVEVPEPGSGPGASPALIYNIRPEFEVSITEEYGTQKYLRRIYFDYFGVRPSQGCAGTGCYCCRVYAEVRDATTGSVIAWDRAGFQGWSGCGGCSGTVAGYGVASGFYGSAVPSSCVPCLIDVSDYSILEVEIDGFEFTVYVP